MGNWEIVSDDEENVKNWEIDPEETPSPTPTVIYINGAGNRTDPTPTPTATPTLATPPEWFDKAREVENQNRIDQDWGGVVKNLASKAKKVGSFAYDVGLDTLEGILPSAAGLTAAAPVAAFVPPPFGLAAGAAVGYGVDYLTREAQDAFTESIGIEREPKSFSQKLMDPLLDVPFARGAAKPIVSSVDDVASALRTTATNPEAKYLTSKLIKSNDNLIDSGIAQGARWEFDQAGNFVKNKGIPPQNLNEYYDIAQNNVDNLTKQRDLIIDKLDDASRKAEYQGTVSVDATKYPSMSPNSNSTARTLDDIEINPERASGGLPPPQEKLYGQQIGYKGNSFALSSEVKEESTRALATLDEMALSLPDTPELGQVTKLIRESWLEFDDIAARPELGRELRRSITALKKTDDAISYLGGYLGRRLPPNVTHLVGSLKKRRAAMQDAIEGRIEAVIQHSSDPEILGLSKSVYRNMNSDISSQIALREGLTNVMEQGRTLGSKYKMSPDSQIKGMGGLQNLPLLGGKLGALNFLTGGQAQRAAARRKLVDSWESDTVADLSRVLTRPTTFSRSVDAIKSNIGVFTSNFKNEIKNQLVLKGVQNAIAESVAETQALDFAELVQDPMAGEQALQVAIQATPQLFEPSPEGYRSFINGKLLDPMEQSVHINKALDLDLSPREQADVIGGMLSKKKYSPIDASRSNPVQMNQPMQPQNPLELFNSAMPYEDAVEVPYSGTEQTGDSFFLDKVKSALDFGADFIPIVGEYRSFNNAIDSGQATLSNIMQGNYGQATLNAGETALNILGSVPMAGTGARGSRKILSMSDDVFRGAKKSLDNASRNMIEMYRNAIKKLDSEDIPLYEKLIKEERLRAERMFSKGRDISQSSAKIQEYKAILQNRTEQKSKLLNKLAQEAKSIFKGLGVGAVATVGSQETNNMIGHLSEALSFKEEYDPMTAQ